MAYSQRTNSLVADSLTGTQTFTASDVVITSTDQGNFPKYEGGRRIVAVRVRGGHGSNERQCHSELFEWYLYVCFGCDWY